jgi:hypothetical protein
MSYAKRIYEEAEQDSLVFNEERAKEFKQYYEYARDDKVVSFIYDGREVLTSYAKYLVQYLELRGLLPREGE